MYKPPSIFRRSFFVFEAALLAFAWLAMPHDARGLDIVLSYSGGFENRQDALIFYWKTTRTNQPLAHFDSLRPVDTQHVDGHSTAVQDVKGLLPDPSTPPEIECEDQENDHSTDESDALDHRSWPKLWIVGATVPIMLLAFLIFRYASSDGAIKTIKLFARSSTRRDGNQFSR
jgi:hypothetical protein